MAPDVVGLVPHEHTHDHLLALPRTKGSSRLPIEVLAAAWFPAAEWEEQPGAEEAARPMAGARFRGVVPQEVARPGVLRLAPGVRVVGPFPLTVPQTQALDLPVGTAEVYAVQIEGVRERGEPGYASEDRDGLGRAFVGGWPEPHELGVVRWMVTAARRSSGAVLVDGSTVLTPDPAASVDLTLFSAQALDPQSALGALRTVISMAQVVGVERSVDGGPQDFVVAGDTPYDGALELRMLRVRAVPQSLAVLEWREYGPYAYRMHWDPADPYDLETERPSGLHLIARSRMRSSLARLAAMLQGRVGGTLVDDGGFVVAPGDLEARLDEAAARRF